MLARQDWTKSYARHRKNLQLIGLNDPEKRWVLKNPSHLFALDAVFAVYPDALILQCHRPAETIMASMCSLAQHTTEGWSNTFKDEVIGADSLETWSRGLETVQHRTRQAQSGAVLRCRLLRAHPRTDQHRGKDLLALRYRADDEARAAIQRTDEESKQGPRAPKHTYSLADYGLTEEQVKERFKGL